MSKNKNRNFFLVLFGILLLLSLGVVFFFKSDYGRPLSGLKRCGMENCHGTDIACGPNIPEVCDTAYRSGDGCRGFADCRFDNGECQLVKGEVFEECLLCVDKCLSDYEDEPIGGSQCESQCVQFFQLKSVGESCLKDVDCSMPPEPYGSSSYGPHELMCLDNRCQVAVNLLTKCDTDLDCDCSSYNPPSFSVNKTKCTCVRQNCLVVVEE